MSVVTNLILTFATTENEAECIMAVNQYENDGLKINLVSADFDKNKETGQVWYGGTKFLEAPLYIGAFNHLDINQFINHLRTIHWEFPELVQIIAKGQEDDKFTIIEL